VQIGSQLYVDGGVRQNTPVAPAIRLGATHVLVVGTSRLVRGVAHTTPGPIASPSATVLLGKIMNALLLDHLDNDLGFVNLLNDLMQSGEAAFGAPFVEKLNESALMRGGHSFRPIEMLVVRPTEGIGTLAAEYLRHGKLRAGPVVTKQVLKLLDSGGIDDADLASYLLFDGGFARRLIDLGRSDAHARRAQVLDFLGCRRGRRADRGRRRGRQLDLAPTGCGLIRSAPALPRALPRPCSHPSAARGQCPPSASPLPRPPRWVSISS
jgi:NTE family protein